MTVFVFQDRRFQPLTHSSVFKYSLQTKAVTNLCSAHQGTMTGFIPAVHLTGRSGSAIQKKAPPGYQMGPRTPEYSDYAASSSSLFLRTIKVKNTKSMPMPSRRIELGSGTLVADWTARRTLSTSNCPVLALNCRKRTTLGTHDKLTELQNSKLNMPLFMLDALPVKLQSVVVTPPRIVSRESV